MKNSMKQKTCLITGGAGFIGSNLAGELLKKGYTVIVLDNLCTGTTRNIEPFQNNPNFSFIRHDVTKEIPVFESVDYIYHLASPASVPDYQRLDEETALVNSVGIRNMLRVAKAYNARFLYTSTSEVYGNPVIHPQVESYWGYVNPNGVRSCYDESKRFGEMMALLYKKRYGVDARIVRIFNTYGPNMRPDDGRVISNFINQALTGKPLTVYGDGSQTRSFCYVDDNVRGLIAVMEKDGISGEVMNLGNPEEYTMLDLANKIIRITKSSSKIEHHELPKDDPERRCPDITKIRKLVGWEPEISVDEGLEKTIEYYKNLRGDGK